MKALTAVPELHAIGKLPEINQDDETRRLQKLLDQRAGITVCQSNAFDQTKHFLIEYVEEACSNGKQGIVDLVGELLGEGKFIDDTVFEYKKALENLVLFLCSLEINRLMEKDFSKSGISDLLKMIKAFQEFIGSIDESDYYKPVLELSYLEKYRYTIKCEHPTEYWRREAVRYKTKLDAEMVRKGKAIATSV